MEELGHLGPLWLVCSTVCKLQEQLGPFWPDSNGAKGGQPVGPPEPTFYQKPQGPKRPEFPIIDHSTQDTNHGLWNAPEAPSHFQEGGFPSTSGKSLAQLKWIQACRNHV
ncbi:hypothetical protein O181_092879 [Austropuccinia psidii MF-1]|uniref:Uncharacterized protein n=1 Tax=Austropuccinia psidii MF-1 TaxID=1389203 RepID=A0A9Q3J0D1_9BASI|nr:hypothetical protein [Austropuccinia psidii MF-1]